MEYANDNYLEINYNTNIKKISVFKRLEKKIKKNKLLSGLILLFGISISIYIILFYNFIKVLQNL